MSPSLILLAVVLYFGFLIFISFLTSKKGDNDTFFLGNKKSPWYVVAFGMIGASLSGVTFISVPGWVSGSQFSYMQMVLGYLIGYFFISFVLLPLYYRLNLTSIYTYLEQRFGFWSYKSGAGFFLISRVIGAAFRLYLVAIVLQFAVFDRLDFEIPFAVTVIITIALIWLYTFKGGIGTIIWTDTLQTFFMLASVGITIWLIMNHMGLGVIETIELIDTSKYSQIFFFDDWNSSKHFVKQFLGGAFISIVMTGLDQDMMQKNLSCKNTKEAQKNMISMSLVLVIVNLFFLGLGALLYIFAEKNGITIPEKADLLYPTIALDGYLNQAVAVFFILGLIAAAYSSADSALTSLTTSFCVDFLDIKNKAKEIQKKWRIMTHIGFSVLLVLVILVFKQINDDSVIKELFVAAGFTYGPILGLFSFGMFTKLNVKDKYVPIICIISPLICYFLKANSETLLNGYKFGFELLILNGFLTFVGLLFISKKIKIG
jgi:Na+/proline symporter